MTMQTPLNRQRVRPHPKHTVCTNLCAHTAPAPLPQPGGAKLGAFDLCAVHEQLKHSSIICLTGRMDQVAYIPSCWKK